jgi:uncharacterized membrane protein
MGKRSRRNKQHSMPIEKLNGIDPREVKKGAMITQTVVSYSAPIPPASEFQKYEAVLPGSADRILGMAERQSKHRHSIEKTLVFFQSASSFLGMILAFILALAGIIAGSYLLLNNKPIEGFTALLTPLGIITSAFIYNQNKNKEENPKK